MATRRRKRQSKSVTSVLEEENDVNSEGQTDSESVSKDVVETEEEAPKKTPEKEQEENQHYQDCQVDAVIEVKGRAPSVTVSWDNKEEGKEEEVIDDKETGTNETEQMMETANEQIPSVSDTVDPTGSTEENTQQEVPEHEEPQIETEAEEDQVAPTETLSEEKKNEEGEGDGMTQEDEEGEEKIVKKTTVKRKQKQSPAVGTSPPKKTKLIYDGFCAFVGNLNNSKKSHEVKDSLARYFMTQSILVQDIRVDKSKKHAHLDLASEIDLNKALKLDGEMMFDKPMKIAIAKVKGEKKAKVRATREERKASQDAKCLFLKNVPCDATKEDIMKVFHKAVTVTFPGGAESPEKGIALVEFANPKIATKLQQKKYVFKIQGQVLIVDSVGAGKVPEVKEDDNNNNNNTKAPAPPNKTLFVNSINYNAKERHLKKVFPKAVNIKIALKEGKSRGFAFVEFVSVAEAEKALESSKDAKIFNRPINVQFSSIKDSMESKNVDSKTLMVVGLSEKTTTETLKSAFEDALSARVITDKVTGVSKRYGFVSFETEESSRAAKEEMEDCEIDGSKITVIYAKPRIETSPAGNRQDTGANGGKAKKRGKRRGARKLKAAAEGEK